jgi:flagellar protein FliS
MSVRTPYQSYQQNAINTASPGELTLMLYNGCLKFIHIAKTPSQRKTLS